MGSLHLNKTFFILLFIFLSLFSFNLSLEYFKYKKLKEEELFSSRFQIINIYDKKDFYVLKLKNDDFDFFTSIPKIKGLDKLNTIDIAFVTSNITFFSYLKGFYSKTLYYENIKESDSFKTSIYKKIKQSHSEIKLKELFSALFLAIPISKEYRQVYTNWGISHLIAISGFHLGIILFIFYWFIYVFYTYIHKRFFIYRNKKFDVLIISSFILFLYLVLTDFSASLFRAFLMFFLGIILLRSNIKILSFKTLLLTLLLIITFFPKYLFSISLWFSIIGVFYIFLYLQYFKNMPKIISFLFFNFWIFLVFNPIVHYFFYNSSFEQFYSPLITIFFTFFYPFELLLHFIGQGGLLDNYMDLFFEQKIVLFEVKTSLWFFIIYIVVSLLSIFKRKAFILLNAFLIFYTIYFILQG